MGVPWNEGTKLGNATLLTTFSLVHEQTLVDSGSSVPGISFSPEQLSLQALGPSRGSRAAAEAGSAFPRRWITQR